MKKPTQKQIKDQMLTGLNDFMKKFDINEIQFGKTHSIKRTEGEQADDIVKTSLKKNKIDHSKCSNCQLNPKSETHSCPYQQDVNGDNSDHCDCCDDCQSNCVDNI